MTAELRSSPSPAPDPRSRAARWRGRLIKLAVSGLAVAVVVSRVDPTELLTVLRRVNPLALAAVFLTYLLGQLITAHRWHVITERVGFSRSFGTIAVYYYIGMFFNLFGPSTLGGDLTRALYLGAPDGRRALALNSVIFDRLVGLVMLIVVAITAMAAFGRQNVPAPLVVLAVGAVGAAIVGWLVARPLVGRLLPPYHPLRRMIEEKLRPLWEDRRMLSYVVVLSVVFHSVQIGAAFMLGTALGLKLPCQYYFVFHPLVAAFAGLPISLAGIGVRELGYVYFLADLQGIPEETALAFGILWFVVLLASSAAGGIVFLASGANLPPLRAARQEPAS